MDEAEILRQLRHYFKMWKKGGYISGALKDCLDNLLFYRDWDIAGTRNQATRQRKWLVKTQKVCQKCGTNKRLTQDHVIPKSKGGKDGLHNKQLLCRDCNVAKGNTL